MGERGISVERAGTEYKSGRVEGSCPGTERPMADAASESPAAADDPVSLDGTAPHPATGRTTAKRSFAGSLCREYPLS